MASSKKIFKGFILYCELLSKLELSEISRFASYVVNGSLSCKVYDAVTKVLSISKTEWFMVSRPSCFA